MMQRLRRLKALCLKETLQIVRDPSTLLIAFGFPILLLFVFGLGVNLDSSVIRLGVALEDDAPAVERFAATLAASPSFLVTFGHDPSEMGDLLRAGRIKGFVVVREDASRRLAQGTATTPTVLLVTDGSEPNTANFVEAYVRGAHEVWLREELARQGRPMPPALLLETRSWFNPSTRSTNFLLPGAITIILTVVGAMLTALVIAREWERGTMEALLSVGISRFELIFSKFLPYFVLGELSFVLCLAMTVFFFHVPMRGSPWLVLSTGGLFLGSALGLGLLLSTALRNQYNAAQAALNVAFLPALMLSGFVFEISSMPWVVRAVTMIVPARYFVTAMQTLFQAGNVWPVLGRELLGLTVAAVVFLGFTFFKTRRRLE